MLRSDLMKSHSMYAKSTNKLKQYGPSVLKSQSFFWRSFTFAFSLPLSLYLIRTHSLSLSLSYSLKIHNCFRIHWVPNIVQVTFFKYGDDVVFLMAKVWTTHNGHKWKVFLHGGMFLDRLTMEKFGLFRWRIWMINWRTFRWHPMHWTYLNLQYNLCQSLCFVFLSIIK